MARRDRVAHQLAVTISPTHDAAVNDGRYEADAMCVDAWLTGEHTHVVKIAANRRPDK